MSHTPKSPPPHTELSLSTKFLKAVHLYDSKAEERDIDVQNIPEPEIESFEDEPYYLNIDESQGVRNNHNVALSVNHKTQRPTLKGLVNTCLKSSHSSTDKGNALFAQGDWVEYLTNNMEWKVGLVNRVVKQVPESWNFEQDGHAPSEVQTVYYNVSVEGLLEKERVRAPKAGLEYIFGKRPFFWQQFVLLKLEKRVRFDEDHEYDFAEIGYLEFASDHFDAWLNAEQNQDFRALYEKQTDSVKFLLKDNLLSPFRLCDQIVDDKENWNFRDREKSVYTYLGVLGSGSPVALLTFCIQIFTPLLLIYNVIFVIDGEPNPRYFFDEDFNFLPPTTFDQWCFEGQNDRSEGKIMIFTVLWLYITTIIPDNYLRFFRTSGGSWTTFSKINSLRQVIWNKNEDTILQQIGFKLDRIMKTGYVSLLNLAMIFILIQTPNALDLILNALAVEFVHQIDEQIANSGWFDGDNRYITAGTIELVLLQNLSLNAFKNAQDTCNEFDIDLLDYVAAVDGPFPLKDVKQARLDDFAQKFMTKKERIFSVVAGEAEKMRNYFAFGTYSKVRVQFGLVDKTLDFLGLKSTALFDRHFEFRTWSRWEKLLFVGRVPENEDVMKSIKENDESLVDVGTSDEIDFARHVVVVLSGIDLVSSLAQVCKKRNFHQVPLKFVLGVLEFVFYWVQIFFPFIVLASLIFVPLCY